MTKDKCFQINITITSHPEIYITLARVPKG